MLIDILVLMVFVNGHPHGADLGQHHIAETGLHHQFDTGHRVRTQQRLIQFDSHPLDGDPRQFGRHRDDRRPHPVSHPELKLRHKPRRPQHPQRVVAEGQLRCSRGVQDPPLYRGQSAQRVQELPRPVRGDPDRHRIRREVSAHQIIFETVAETHLRVSRNLVIAVGPKCGDLQPLARLADADGAVVDPGIPHRIRPRAHDFLHHLRPGIGGEVEVGGQPAEGRVAHAAAHQIQLMARGCEQPTHLAQQRSLRAQLDSRPSEQLIFRCSFGHVR